MAKHRKPRMRPLWIAPARVLRAVIHTSHGRQFALVLCDRCLAKRRKRCLPWNRSARAYDSGRFVGWGRHSPPEWYSWGQVVRPHEKVECHDCGFKLHGTNRQVDAARPGY